MLLMKKVFFEAIRSGTKTTTLRYWLWPHCRVGRTEKIRGLGRVLIEDLREVEFEHLTEADARADGFDSLDELRRELEAMYPPDKRDGRKLYKIRFSLLEDAPEPG